MHDQDVIYIVIGSTNIASSKHLEIVRHRLYHPCIFQNQNCAQVIVIACSEFIENHEGGCRPRNGCYSLVACTGADPGNSPRRAEKPAFFAGAFRRMSGNRTRYMASRPPMRGAVNPAGGIRRKAPAGFSALRGLPPPSGCSVLSCWH